MRHKSQSGDAYKWATYYEMCTYNMRMKTMDFEQTIKMVNRTT